jgi:hypothetical protein
MPIVTHNVCLKKYNILGQFLISHENTLEYIMYLFSNLH